MSKQSVRLNASLRKQLEKQEEAQKAMRAFPIRNRITSVLSQAAPRTLGRTSTHVLLKFNELGLTPALNETSSRIHDILDGILKQEGQ